MQVRQLTRMKSSLFVMLRKMQLAPNAFLNSLWTFSLEQLQIKKGAQRHSAECGERFTGETGTRKRENKTAVREQG